MVDTGDLKSPGSNRLYGFKSRLRQKSCCPPAGFCYYPVITGPAGTLGPVWSGLVSAYVFSVFYLWRLDKFRRRRTP